jgi:hypothetical protein
MSQILGVYCPWQWPLLTTEERHHFQNLEIMTETAKALNEILTPVHLNGRIELIPYYCDKQEVLDARKELYGGAIKLDPNQDGVGISSTIKLHPDQDGIDILSTIAPLESKGDHLPEYRLKVILVEMDPYSDAIDVPGSQ